MRKKALAHFVPHLDMMKGVESVIVNEATLTDWPTADAVIALIQVDFGFATITMARATILSK